jgi:hypothetical protein
MIYVRIRAVAGSEASDGLTSQTVGELVMICRLKSLDVILLDISGLVAADRLSCWSAATNPLIACFT